MERIEGNVPVPDRYRGGVIALGNFDGFHMGHQAVVGHALEMARRRNVPTLIATFDPHPITYFKPDASPFRLTTMDQRAALFAAAGADAMMVFNFDAALASLSAEEFARQFLSPFSGVVTGEDFTFGKGRDGNTQVLAALGSEMGFATIAVNPVCDSEVISSSRIRTALQQGDCATATALLTRPFTVQGVVQHGDKNGRLLGFPTANIDMADYLRPRYGIYAVRATLEDGRQIDGVANIGIRPSFQPPKELLETYLFDFNEQLYDHEISVQLIDFIRPEEKFDNLEDLKQAMSRDCIIAREILDRCGEETP